MFDRILTFKLLNKSIFASLFVCFVFGPVWSSLFIPHLNCTGFHYLCKRSWHSKWLTITPTFNVLFQHVEYQNHNSLCRFVSIFAVLKVTHGAGKVWSGSQKHLPTSVNVQTMHHYILLLLTDFQNQNKVTKVGSVGVFSQDFPPYEMKKFLQ